MDCSDGQRIRLKGLCLDDRAVDKEKFEQLFGDELVLATSGNRQAKKAQASAAKVAGKTTSKVT